MPRNLQRFQALLLVQLEEGINEGVEIALHDLVEVEVLFAAAFAAQTMIRAAVLGEVVGSDALAAIAAAHHGLAGAGDGGVLFGLLGFVEGGAEQGPGALLVLGLGFVLGHLELKAAGFVDDAPAGFNFVDVLPAGAAAAAALLFDVFGIDLDLYIGELGEHGDRG